MSSKAIAAIALFGALIATPSFAAANPTVASEIGRGFVATSACVATYVPNTGPMAKCVRDTAKKAQASGAEVRAFEVGLYYGACLNFNTLAQSDASLAKINKVAAADLPTAKAAFAEAHRKMRLVQQQLGLTDEQIVAATPIIASARAAAVTRLGQWGSAPAR